MLNKVSSNTYDLEVMPGVPLKDKNMVREKWEEFLRNVDEERKVFPRLFETANAMAIGDADFTVVEAALLGFQGRVPSDLVPAFLSDSLGPPWKVPRTLPGAGLISVDHINAVLEASMSVQMDKLYGTEFEECFMSGDSLTVCGVLHTYLKYTGINSEFHTGILRVGDRGLPMVWLTIQGTLIDNTYHHWPGDESRDLDKQLVRLKRVENYSEEDPTTTKTPLLAEVGSRTCVSDPKLLKAYATSQNIGKYLAVRAGFHGVYPHFQLYVGGLAKIERLRIIQTHPLPHKRLQQHCWYCDTKAKSLKVCIVCREAMYCNAECQAADWPVHKLLHKDIKANMEFHKAAAQRKCQGQEAPPSTDKGWKMRPSFAFRYPGMSLQSDGTM